MKSEVYNGDVGHTVLRIDVSEGYLVISNRQGTPNEQLLEMFVTGASRNTINNISQSQINTRST